MTIIDPCTASTNKPLSEMATMLQSIDLSSGSLTRGTDKFVIALVLYDAR